MGSVAILLILSLLAISASAGPVTCAACAVGCGVTCAFTLFGVAPCAAACVTNFCAIPCALSPI